MTSGCAPLEEVGAIIPTSSADYQHVDACCMRMVVAPERFDVIVTTNMFGDIITDLGAVLQGGMGLAASGNINPERTAPSMFEPVHGSAPDIAGKGIANPLAAILSLAMMFDHLGQHRAGDRIRGAVQQLLLQPAPHGRPRWPGHHGRGRRGRPGLAGSLNDFDSFYNGRMTVAREHISECESPRVASRRRPRSSRKSVRLGAARESKTVR